MQQKILTGTWQTSRIYIWFRRLHQKIAKYIMMTFAFQSTSNFVYGERGERLQTIALESNCWSHLKNVCFSIYKLNYLWFPVLLYRRQQVTENNSHSFPIKNLFVIKLIVYIAKTCFYQVQ